MAIDADDLDSGQVEKYPSHRSGRLLARLTLAHYAQLMWRWLKTVSLNGSEFRSRSVGHSALQRNAGKLIIGQWRMDPSIASAVHLLEPQECVGRYSR